MGHITDKYARNRKDGTAYQTITQENKKFFLNTLIKPTRFRGCEALIEMILISFEAFRGVVGLLSGGCEALIEMIFISVSPNQSAGTNRVFTPRRVSNPSKASFHFVTSNISVTSGFVRTCPDCSSRNARSQAGGTLALLPVTINSL